jgi:hypothetical protein
MPADRAMVPVMVLKQAFDQGKRKHRGHYRSLDLNERPRALPLSREKESTRRKNDVYTAK